MFSPSLLQVAAGDLWQLMAAFSRVYEADLRAYCCRDAPSFSPDPDVFQRTLRLLETLVTVPQHGLSVQTSTLVFELLFCSSGTGGAEGSARGLCVHEAGSEVTADAAALRERRTEAPLL